MRGSVGCRTDLRTDLRTGTRFILTAPVQLVSVYYILHCLYIYSKLASISTYTLLSIPEKHSIPSIKQNAARANFRENE